MKPLFLDGTRNFAMGHHVGTGCGKAAGTGVQAQQLGGRAPRGSQKLCHFRRRESDAPQRLGAIGEVLGRHRDQPPSQTRMSHMVQSLCTAMQDEVAAAQPTTVPDSFAPQGKGDEHP